MIDFLRLLANALTRLIRSRARLEAEILILRHQLNVLRRRAPKRVAIKGIDRLVFMGLYRLTPGQRYAANAIATRRQRLFSSSPIAPRLSTRPTR